MPYLTAIKTAIQTATQSTVPLDSLGIENNVYGGCRIYMGTDPYSAVTVTAECLWSITVMIQALEDNGFFIGHLGVVWDSRKGMHICQLYPHKSMGSLQ